MPSPVGPVRSHDDLPERVFILVAEKVGIRWGSAGAALLGEDVQKNAEIGRAATIRPVR
jgi:hypothetical protein